MGQIQNLIDRLSGDNEVLIPNGTDFTNNGVGFWLSLPEAATVHYQTWGGQIVTRTLPAGDHAVKVSKVFADNASVVYACW